MHHMFNVEIVLVDEIDSVKNFIILNGKFECIISKQVKSAKSG